MRWQPGIPNPRHPPHILLTYDTTEGGATAELLTTEWGTPARRIRAMLVASVQIMNRRKEGPNSRAEIVPAIPSASSAIATTADIQPSQRGSAPNRIARTAQATKRTVSGKKLRKRAAPPTSFVSISKS